MASGISHSPRYIPQVTISSTFKDLKSHRAALIKCIRAHGLAEVAMENDSAKLTDVIESSLKMVQDGAAYIGIISQKYGQTPIDPVRNPNGLSITELEFNEAMRLNRPILLFIMGEHHSGHKDDFEHDPEKLEKLNAFRKRAKCMSEDSAVERVYAEFGSLADFKEKIGSSIANLRGHLESEPVPNPASLERRQVIGEPIPMPSAFYAEPPYIGSHKFIGRQAQLDELSDWALPADPHAILLFEAIGGNGKSMLTWEWTNNHATEVRADWEGRFWYSFYERGAIMADFCQRALAYMTGQPLEKFRKRKTRDLTKELLAQLHAKPWLLILDGLERVLVAYHRIDAAEVADEEVNTPKDKIANRDPCLAIRDEDDDLLRLLAAAAPSKILISSRLTPRILLNPASQPIPGVRRVTLPGLRPADAEALLRSCGVRGDSKAIQQYLTANCDCHPLVIGVLAGLINDYLPSEGDFDAWAADPNGGGQLDMANLDLIQRRNHILLAAFAALPEKSSQLLSTLSLLSESIDYATLSALNPHLPPEPAFVPVPRRPGAGLPVFFELSGKGTIQETYKKNLQLRKEYEDAMAVRLQSAEYAAAPLALAETIRDLKRRRLLQHDDRAKRYDLHPVVRGVVNGRLKAEERERYGDRVADYFSRQSDNPYDEAQTLDDVSNGLNLVRTLVKIGKFERAVDVYVGNLNRALLFNLEAYTQILALLRPFFLAGWGNLPTHSTWARSSLAIDAARALSCCGEIEEALTLETAILSSFLQEGDFNGVFINVANMSEDLFLQNRFAHAARTCELLIDVAIATGDEEREFMGKLLQFSRLARFGKATEAAAKWAVLDSLSRPKTRELYRPGDAEAVYVRFQFCVGNLQEEHLRNAEQLSASGRNRSTIRELHQIRGEWLMEQGKWASASASLQEAVLMAREREIENSEAEAALLLAKFRAGELLDPRSEAERLSRSKKPANRYLSMLWLAIGEPGIAQKHALMAYERAWADGEPYVDRYELNKATALLQALGVPIPSLPPYDPAKNGKFPWEDAVAAAIELARAENLDTDEEE
ncbi:MAG TPA: DUF4062 domain-containing protein [Rhizomicrobium sp.]|jgi:hypothetical protein